MFDTMESSLRGPTEKWANSEAFSAMLMTVSSNWHSLNEKTRDNLSKVMHAANVPSHSDVTKLMRQVGALTGKIDSLAARLETIEDQLAVLIGGAGSAAPVSTPEQAPAPARVPASATTSKTRSGKRKS